MTILININQANKSRSVVYPLKKETKYSIENNTTKKESTKYWNMEKIENNMSVIIEEIKKIIKITKTEATSNSIKKTTLVTINHQPWSGNQGFLSSLTREVTEEWEEEIGSIGNTTEKKNYQQQEKWGISQAALIRSDVGITVIPYVEKNPDRLLFESAPVSTETSLSDGSFQKTTQFSWTTIIGGRHMRIIREEVSTKKPLGNNQKEITQIVERSQILQNNNLRLSSTSTTSVFGNTKILNDLNQPIRLSNIYDCTVDFNRKQLNLQELENNVAHQLANMGKFSAS